MIEVGTDPGHVALFASDMHLDDGDADCARHFLDALATAAATATHLFLLGDLFEAWIGDDVKLDPENSHNNPGGNPDEDHQSSVTGDFIAHLGELARRGVQIFVMRGNRDFLLDVALPGRISQEPFTQQASARLLDDPATICLFGRTVLLAHGDALCTGDHAYQHARTIVRSRQWQDDFLSRSRSERLAIARSLRDASQRAQAARMLATAEPADVDEEAVIALLNEHAADALIHGHTHRPARHLHRVGERICERWVLPDWCPMHAGQTPRGGFLRVDRDGWRRNQIS